jgi:hypothetical protein
MDSVAKSMPVAPERILDRLEINCHNGLKDVPYFIAMFSKAAGSVQNRKYFHFENIKWRMQA